jgi:hypothetical protein
MRRLIRPSDTFSPRGEETLVQTFAKNLSKSVAPTEEGPGRVCGAMHSAMFLAAPARPVPSLTVGMTLVQTFPNGRGSSFAPRHENAQRAMRGERR